MSFSEWAAPNLLRFVIEQARTKASAIKALMIDVFYTDHNRSAHVERTLSSFLSSLDAGEIGLNVGSGNRRLHAALTNLDIEPGDCVDVVGSAEALPFPDGTFAVVVSQETLEHVRDPFGAVREMHRVLTPGGRLYLQVPFIIGYHPGPTDYWRFTREGVRELVEQAGFQCDGLKTSVGPAVGFHRIAVEFVAGIAAMFFGGLYRPVKGLTAMLLYPVKLLDPLFVAQRDRIPGGYIVIATKEDSDQGELSSGEEDGSRWPSR